MIIDCISDLHGHYPKLGGGDLLIVAGDLTVHDRFREYYDFAKWLKFQDYQKKVVIAGNHDNEIHKHSWNEIAIDFDYLCDSGTKFKDLKIWGSPWTKKFEGMNPDCTAFTVDTDEELAEKWELIPDDIDILVTHTPPFGIFDEVKDLSNGKIEHTGSLSLLERVYKIRPKLHVFGHIHEGYGNILIRKDENYEFDIHYINASHVNEHYKPVNKLIRVEL